MSEKCKEIFIYYTAVKPYHRISHQILGSLGMKIKTQLSASLTAIVALLLVVSFGAYWSITMIRDIATYYPDELLPGVRNFEKIRQDTQKIEIAVYQRDAETIKLLSQDLLKRIQQFASLEGTPKDSPFYNDAFLKKNLSSIGSTMSELVRVAQEENLNTPPSSSFIAAVEKQKKIEFIAEETINYLVNGTSDAIDQGISSINRLLMVLNAFSIVFSVVVGFWLVKKMMKGIAGLQRSFTNIASGDLTVKADDKRNDEFGELAASFNKLASSQRDTIKELIDIVQKLSVVSDQFRSTGEVFKTSADTTSEETQLLATAMTEMSSTSAEVAKNAELTSVQANEALGKVDSVNGLIMKSVDESKMLLKQMSQTTSEVNELKDKSASISSIVDVIQEIAEQTNLLALNAAIEAARAGEQGRGFAVVADEVRTLANRTGESTQEISEVINELQKLSELTNKNIENNLVTVESSARSIEQIGKEVAVILSNIQTISDMNYQVAANATEQSQVSEDMNTNVIRITDLSENNANEASKINAEIVSMDELSRTIKHIVQSFRV